MKNSESSNNTRTIIIAVVISVLIVVVLWFAFTEEGQKRTEEKRDKDVGRWAEDLWDKAKNNPGQDPHDLPDDPPKRSPK